MAEGLALTLPAHGIEVVAHMINSVDLLAAYPKVRPDVVQLDVGLGTRTSGIAAGENLLSAYPDAKVVFFSIYDDLHMIAAGYRAGAMAYITKITPVEVLAEAIRTAAQGEVFYLPGIAERVCGLAQRRTGVDPRESLTDRELQVLIGIARSKSNEDLAADLGCTAKTVGVIRQRVLEVCDIKDAAEASALADRYGLLM